MADRRAWPPLTYLAAATAVVLAVYALFSFGRTTGRGLLLTFLGVLLALAVRYPIDALARVVPRALATVATLVASLAVLALLLWLALPTVSRQSALAARQIPGVLAQLQAKAEDLSREGPLAGALDQRFWDALREHLAAWASGLVGEVTGIVSGALGAAIAFVFVLGIAFFTAHDPGLYVNGFLHLVPAPRRPRMERLLAELGRHMQRWIAGAVVSMLLVGLLTAGGLFLLGIDGWLVLALLAFLLEFVPFAGPILSAIPGILLALSVSPLLAVWTALVYLAVQQVEGNLLQPLIMKRAVYIPPALLLVWQVAAALAFGLVGLLVATPLLAAILVVVRVYYLEGDADYSSASYTTRSK